MKPRFTYSVHLICNLEKVNFTSNFLKNFAARVYFLRVLYFKSKIKTQFSNIKCPFLPSTFTPQPPEKQTTNLNSFFLSREDRSEWRSCRLVFPGYREGMEKCPPFSRFPYLHPHFHLPLTPLGLRPLDPNKRRQHWGDTPGWHLSLSPTSSPAPHPYSHRDAYNRFYPFHHLFILENSTHSLLFFVYVWCFVVYNLFSIFAFPETVPST